MQLFYVLQRNGRYLSNNRFFRVRITDDFRIEINEIKHRHRVSTTYDSV